ncbi:hypothetical protein CQU01_03500 [Cerasibacillus quisquiliarum]|uniref:Uncharacterized protein n=1 Tax=Cerasibacillus quisquiliarum TaxID=227865 RepID=A0A511UYB1_9BACI|nr:hypothetical protein CQU01_03500 [Cerasibacillus quisquiliarum]
MVIPPSIPHLSHHVYVVSDDKNCLFKFLSIGFINRQANLYWLEKFQNDDGR